MIGIGLLGLVLLAGLGWRLAQTGELSLASATPAPIAASSDHAGTAPASTGERSAPMVIAPVVTAPVVATPLPAPVTATTPPAVETQPQPPAATAQARPSFDIVRISPQGGAVIAGRATPNADVTVRDNGQEIGHAQADPSGQFVVLPDKPLESGGQELTLAAREPGKPEVTGDAPVVLLVPSRAPAKQPTDANAEAKLPAAPLAVLTPSNAAPRLLQAGPADQAATRSSGKVGLDVVDYDDRGAIRFAGSGAPGSVVRLYVDNLAVGEAPVDLLGRWGLMPLAPIGPGDHRLRVDELGARGQVVARVELPFQRAVLTPDDVQAGHLTVQPGQSLWRIARRAYGQGIRYTIIYQANRNQIRNADLIYPGQVFAIPALDGAVPPTASTGTSASASKSK